METGPRVGVGVWVKAEALLPQMRGMTVSRAVGLSSIPKDQISRFCLKLTSPLEDPHGLLNGKGLDSRTIL